MISTSREEILQAALALGPEDRLALSAEILASLDPVEDGVEASWDEELDRRADRLDCGDAVLVPGDEVLRELDRGFPR